MTRFAQVTGPVAVAKFGDTEAYFYRGANLPKDVSEAEVARLVDIGLVTVIDIDEPEVVPPAAPLTAADIEAMATRLEAIEAADRQRLENPAASGPDPAPTDPSPDPAAPAPAPTQSGKGRGRPGNQA